MLRFIACCQQAGFICRTGFVPVLSVLLRLTVHGFAYRRFVQSGRGRMQTNAVRQPLPFSLLVFFRDGFADCDGVSCIPGLYIAAGIPLRIDGQLV